MTRVRIMIVRLNKLVKVATGVTIAMREYAPYVRQANRIRNAILDQV